MFTHHLVRILQQIMDGLDGGRFPVRVPAHDRAVQSGGAPLIGHLLDRESSKRAGVASEVIQRPGDDRVEIEVENAPCQASLPVRSSRGIMAGVCFKGLLRSQKTRQQHSSSAFGTAQVT